MTLLAFSIVGSTVLLSAFVQGSTGMGFAMIMAPVVSFIDPSLIPVMLLVLMISLNFYVAATERKDIDWHGVKWSRFAGTFFGLWILVIVNSTSSPCSSAGRRSSPPSSRCWGPPYAPAYQHSPDPELRSTVAACFLVGKVISLIVLAISGQLIGPVLGYIVFGFAIVSGAVVIVQA